jgi:hypothetical protein
MSKGFNDFYYGKLFDWYDSAKFRTGTPQTGAVSLKDFSASVAIFDRSASVSLTNYSSPFKIIDYISQEPV